MVIGLPGDRKFELVPNNVRNRSVKRVTNRDKPDTINSKVNHGLALSSAKSRDVEEVSGLQLDSQATCEHTNEHCRGNNLEEVVFASKDYLEQVKRYASSNLFSLWYGDMLKHKQY